MNLFKGLAALLCIIILSGCTKDAAQVPSNPEPKLPVTKEEKSKFLARQLVPAMSEKFIAWAGSDRERKSRGLVYELDSKSGIGSLRYNLNSDDYWSIFWNQQVQTRQDFITYPNSSRYGNPWCQQYTVDIFAQLSYAFYLESTKYPDWEIWPSNGLVITINNYTYESSKDKYGNLLPDKLIDYKDAFFGIKMSDLNRVNWESGEMDLTKLDSLKSLTIPDIGFCTKSFVMGAILGG